MPRIRLDKPTKGWVKEFFINPEGALSFRLHRLMRYYDSIRLHSIAQGLNIGSVVYIHYTNMRTANMYLRILRSYSFLSVWLNSKKRFIGVYLKEDDIAIEHIRIITENNWEFPNDSFIN